MDSDKNNQDGTNSTTNKMKSENVNNDKNATNEDKIPKKKITIEVDEDDPCLKKDAVAIEATRSRNFPGEDPRFQQQNQTLRCWVMYTDFYRCEHILGEGSSACTWFKDVFKSICPNHWIYQWDKYRAEGTFGWHKYRTQGEFPGHSYGD